jgi:hypothetical protein
MPPNENRSPSDELQSQAVDNPSRVTVLVVVEVVLEARSSFEFAAVLPAITFFQFETSPDGAGG